MVSDFWRFDHVDSTNRLAEWDHDVMDLEQVLCPLDQGHQRGGKRLTDLHVMLRGKRVEDVVWTWQSECLLQDRVVDLMRSEGFTGYELKPVKARFERYRDQAIPSLHELVVTGWAGMARPESGIALVERCPACGYLVYSGCRDAERLIDSRQWDGSDFFMVWPLPAFIFVTDRVRCAFQKARFRGVVFRRPESVPCRPDNGFGPGRLSYWMPRERAEQLGGHLDIV